MINPNHNNIISKKWNPTLQELKNGVLESNTIALSKAITLIESDAAIHQEQAQQLLNECLKFKKDSVRIGITGIPGVGKSTFIESLGNYIIKLGKKVAVLAVDPSSSINKGSILGDKTRMQHLSKQPQAYIRPSAAGHSLGGVAKKTKESIILCEAAGYDVILIETVGVGQSETLVHSMVDFFLLLKISGSGDGLQGIKRGIIEMADGIAINKADGHNIKSSQLAQKEFERALHLYPVKESGWAPKVVTCSALQNQGIDKIWTLIYQYISTIKQNKFFEKNRIQQDEKWLHQIVQQQLHQEFYNCAEVNQLLPGIINQIHKGEITPFSAAELLMKLYKKRGN